MRKLVEILADEAALDGVLLWHDGGDAEEWRSSGSLLCDLFHQRGVLDSEPDLEIDDVDEGGSV